MPHRKTTKKRVFVGLSGGVDSSVTAALLKKRGFDVEGVYIKGWYPDWKECDWKDHRRDAMRVAAHLDIPFHTLDMSEEYKKDVIDYFLAEYKKGNTPNPDVMCNKHIKFGGFYEWALSQGADFVATGHYARVQAGADGFSLLRGKDISKDQSYFLWAIQKGQLQKVLFPVGDLEKKEVRKLSKRFNLPTAQKADSQGICFLEGISMKEFLKHYLPVESGDVLNEKGEKIGTHEGAVLYTLGQRHGFETEKNSQKEKPNIVIAKDVQNNTITVSHEDPTAKTKNSYVLSDTNWHQEPDQHVVYQAQARYRQQPFFCRLQKKKDVWNVITEDSVEAPTPGQSLVVYEKELLIGGGILEPTPKIKYPGS